MTLFTIGFTKKSAEEFFETLKKNKVKLVVDVRLNNRSQLAGFTKDRDLRYFLDKICTAQYIHCEEYAPTKDLLDRYHKKTTSWDEYVTEYRNIMENRKVCEKFMDRFSYADRVCLLCSETTPEQCHRRLLAEMIKEKNEGAVSIIHL